MRYGMHLHFILLFICKFGFLFFIRGELFEVKRGPELPIQEKYVLLLTQFFFFFKFYFFILDGSRDAVSGVDIYISLAVAAH